MKSFAFRKNSFTILVTHNHLNNNNLKGQTLNIETMRHNQCGICFSLVNGKGFFFFGKDFGSIHTFTFVILNTTSIITSHLVVVKTGIICTSIITSQTSW